MVSAYMKEKSLQETPARRDSTGSRNLNLVANRTQDPLLDEAVEAGRMSRWGHPTLYNPKLTGRFLA